MSCLGGFLYSSNALTHGGGEVMTVSTGSQHIEVTYLNIYISMSFGQNRLMQHENDQQQIYNRMAVKGGG